MLTREVVMHGMVLESANHIILCLRQLKHPGGIRIPAPQIIADAVEGIADKHRILLAAIIVMPILMDNADSSIEPKGLSSFCLMAILGMMLAAKVCIYDTCAFLSQTHLYTIGIWSGNTAYW